MSGVPIPNRLADMTDYPVGGLQARAERGLPNGYPGLNGDGHLVGTYLGRRVLESDTVTVLAAGEFGVRVDNLTTPTRVTPVVGDGLAVGGLPFNRVLTTGSAITVSPFGTDAQSGNDLLTAYTAAKALTPGGNAISASNPAVLLIAPGTYDLGSQTLTLDNANVYVCGLGAREGVVIKSTGNVIADTVGARIENLTASCTSTAAVTGVSTDKAAFAPTTAVVSNVSNCQFLGTATGTTLTTGGFSTRPGVEYAGTYTDVLTNSADAWGGVADSLFASNPTACSGTWTRCRSTYAASAIYGAWGYLGTVKATARFVECEGLNGSFAFGGIVEAGAAFVRCKGGSQSFCAQYFGKPSQTNAGTYVDCEATSGCYGGYASGPADVYANSGTYLRCRGTTFCFLRNSNCTFSGRMIDCEATSLVDGTFSGEMRGYVGRISASAVFTGVMDNCHLTQTSANANAVTVGANARIYNSTLIATGTGKSVGAGSALSAKIAHCRLNLGIHANVTNLIASPNNVEDTDFT